MTLLDRTVVEGRQSSRSYLGLGLGALGLLLWLVALHDANFLQMGPLGLVSILRWPYFVGLALALAGFSFELLHSPLRPKRLIALIILLVFIMYGTASAVEPVAELVTSWVHAGYIQYVIQHGKPLNNFDASFSWPGGFSLGALMVAFTGQANAVAFLRWFPLAAELAYLAPLLVIARYSGVSRRTGYLAIALFYATNWIDQDYFSPQALNYLFFLVVLAAVFACWQPKPIARAHEIRGYWRARIAQTRAALTFSRFDGGDVISTWSSGLTLWVLGLLGLVCLASAVSHQLTPYALILALCCCLVTRRLGRPELILVAAVLAVGWLSLGASNYWLGHLSDIFGSAGQLNSTIGSNITGRVTGSSSHLFIVELRIGITLGLFFLAGIGFLRRYANSRMIEALAAVPFLLLTVQNYGGEGLLRVVLYGLPFTSLLAASAILPGSAGTIRAFLPKLRIGRYGRLMLRAAVVVVLFGFCVATTIGRGGNDAYESFSHGELAAMNYAYRHVHSGQTIGVVAVYLPIGQKDVGSVNVYAASGGAVLPTVAQVSRDLVNANPAYIVLSQSQEAWGEILADYPRGWEATVESTLVQRGFHIVAAWQTATVLRANTPKVTKH